MAVIEFAYGTKTGCTRDVCESIAASLRLLGHTATLHEAATAPPPSAQVVVLASGVRAGTWNSGVTRWATAHAAALGSRPVVALSVCLDALDDRDKAAGHGRTALASTGIQPALAASLPGRMILAEYGFLERQIMRKISQEKGLPEGDHRDPRLEREVAESIAALT